MGVAIKRNATTPRVEQIERISPNAPTKMEVAQDDNLYSVDFSVRRKSALLMALALSVHLGGYELARGGVVALFTSDELGFGRSGGGGLSALPLAVGCVSPFSILVLWVYGRSLRWGPARALRTHTLITSFVPIFCASVLKILERSAAGERRWSQFIIFFAFVFQNAYVQLLYAQHWAFLSSVLTSNEGKRLFAPIAGLGSIGSTFCAGLVSHIVGRIGLTGLMYLAACCYLVCASLSEYAFVSAGRGHFAPKLKGTPQDGSITTNGGNRSPYKGSTFDQARLLFGRVPVLRALFVEIIISQSLSSLVNFIFLINLKASIASDELRAGWSGSFYMWINGVSGIFQFILIPRMLKFCDARRFWLGMPVVMILCTSHQFKTIGTNDLLASSASFFAIKTMEYSLRGAANEMIYVNLDFESRYLGKKVVSLVAGKFGKSGMALILAALMTNYGESSGAMPTLVLAAVVFSFLWLIASIKLHYLIGTS